MILLQSAMVTSYLHESNDINSILLTKNWIYFSENVEKLIKKPLSIENRRKTQQTMFVWVRDRRHQNLNVAVKSKLTAFLASRLIN